MLISFQLFSLGLCGAESYEQGAGAIGQYEQDAGAAITKRMHLLSVSEGSRGASLASSYLVNSSKKMVAAKVKPGSVDYHISHISRSTGKCTRRISNLSR